MTKDSKIYVAGHSGMVGSAIMRKLNKNGYNNVIYKSSAELDLRMQADVEEFFANEKPDYVFMSAALVGGIKANSSYPADFLMDNLDMQNNIFRAAFKHNVKKLLFLGSSCIYPKSAEMPIKETSLLSDYLEPTNEPYSLAKISGIKACEYYNRQFGSNYIAVMPANSYGINDNFDPENSHVIPALIQRCHNATINGDKNITIWGTGSPLREFLYVDDLADACLFLMEGYADSEYLNIGTSEEISMLTLAKTIAEKVGFKGEILCDPTKPDGMMRRIIDSSKIEAIGWKATTTLDEGIEKTYKWFLESIIN